MTESNPTQVILTDDGLKIIKANNAAAVANNGVKDINSDNKLTPNEKLSLKRLYDSDVLKHDFDVKQLTSMSLPTADIDLALSNLTAFTARYFVNMDITEEVDRQALNKVFNDFDNADKAVDGLFNDAVQQVADDAKKAGDDAKQAGEEAQTLGQEAKASAEQAQTDATQAKSDALTAQQKAQSSIDQLNAHLPDIDTALSTANLVKQNVTKLSDTTEQYHNEYTTGIQNVISTVDNMTISNRNLVLRTTASITTTGTNKVGQTLGDYPTSNEVSAISVGTKLTISCDIDVTNADGGKSYFGWAGAHAWQTFINAKTFTEGKNHVSLTFDLDSALPVGTILHISIDNSTATYSVSNLIISESSKEVSWSPAPEDLATNTEFDQLSNAIKLKADSSDVTSQITVATQGIQSEVDNKVTDLSTKISQTSDAVQILNTTSGLRNLVYNSSYSNNAEGWNMFDKLGYLSTLAVSSYNGSPGFGVNISGKSDTTWTQFGQSKFYALPQPDAVTTENTYSASAVIKFYEASSKECHISATISYYDKNNKRILWKDMLINGDNIGKWTTVKVENFAVPQGAYYVCMQFWAYGSKVHGMIAQPMIVFGPKIGPYNPDAVSQSDITASIDNIHLGVKNADGSTSNFNMNGNTILMDTARTIINGNTSIQNGTIGTAKIANAAINTAQIADGAINNAKIANAAINDAKISNLNGNKIIAGSITAQQLNANDIIANVINGKTINGITITTPNLQLGTNGILSEDWSLNQATSLFNPKKGSGTMTLTQGLLATSGTLSRWWSDDGGYWYGIGDDGSKIKNGSNQVGDNYGAGYAQHNIFDSKGNTLLRTYMDATGLYMNSGGTSNVNTVLTQQGLTTTNVTALGDINGASLTTSGWINAGISSGNGIRIGFRTIQSHNTQDLYFNGDDNKQSVTLHAKSIVQSSQLSRKKDIKPLDPDYAMKVIRNSDMYGYRYNEDSPTEPLHYSGIIDDVNGTPQYKMPAEFISEDRTGRNDGNTVAFLVEALKQADKRIGILEGMMNSD
ncbi:hypothetical protein [Pediococcus pentosaceus]|uniref:hypothetical protein n=1 Tax=Pediococcus pentosaceus TaxID=1255 RepID=UPI0023AFD049|nr:hypothetical protein [Pediococcus pentosaceus]MDE7510838.1 hypothetical protein [Pediococcus pentosaceus]